MAMLGKEKTTSNQRRRSYDEKMVSSCNHSDVCSWNKVASYAAPAPKITTETFFIDASDPGIKLHVRNKHLSPTKSFPQDKIVLFVHGATYPSETAFDIALPGGSWMDYAATQGYDTYLADIRGYGRSTRPASMDGPPDQNPAFASTADGIRDVGAAVDFIRKRRNVDKINLVGWSWGTSYISPVKKIFHKKSSP